MFACRVNLVVALCAAAAAGLPPAVRAQGAGREGPRRAAEALRAAGDLRDAAARARAVDALRRAEAAARAKVRAKAAARGLALRGALAGGGAWELVDFDGERPVYRSTLNASAAISTAADLVRSSPYFASGAGGAVGVWDACAALATHQEFGGRVAVKDGSDATVYHPTHVAGTICAAGVNAAAMGMAPLARVDSYDWNDDVAEMAARGASYPAEAGKLGLSNHSYVEASEGWVYTGQDSPVYVWGGLGADASAVEDDFGKYDDRAAAADALACGLPYFLSFWAAGNDRGDVPSNGQAVSLDGYAVVSYNQAQHPPSDKAYRGGYDTISHDALAKNVIAVGSVTDAVSNGVRNLLQARGNSWASWGPADDGRIKPDLVANGFALCSSAIGGNAAYMTNSGTSMASPNAAGTAQLLAHYFGILFTNQAMRASTLKALLIHTADDLGAAGPDYVFGWGLINAKAAADVLKAYQTNASGCRVIEDRVATNRAFASFDFVWDGSSPIRATLCWTDPAGVAVSNHDYRIAALVNNLDLRVAGPAGATHEPWVMPYVGDWRTNALSAAAVAGSNRTDNVEQVAIASPGAPGLYTARVTFAGSLAGGSQAFSLVVTGGSGAPGLPAPSVSGVASEALGGTNRVTLAGGPFCLGADVRLRRIGAADVVGASVEALGDSLAARFGAAAAGAGRWSLVVTNPDGRRAVLDNVKLSASGAFLWTRGTVLTVR